MARRDVTEVTPKKSGLSDGYPDVSTVKHGVPGLIAASLERIKGEFPLSALSPGCRHQCCDGEDNGGPHCGGREVERSEGEGSVYFSLQVGVE
jgi:hypothetical protein